MGANGSAKKLLGVGLVVGLLFIVLRTVRSGGEEESIDRIDTGNERNDSPVETGLDRVETADEESEDEESSTGTVTAGGRFDELDVFDYIAIFGAAFEAARSEYDSRL